MHGIEQACQKLKIDVNKITQFQAASLISRLKYPEPRYFNVEKRRKLNLRTMYILKKYGEIYGTISYS